MKASDRVFGLVMMVLALAYIASAFQIRTSFLSDPIGPKAFPIGVGAVIILSSLFMVFRPDPEPEWPGIRSLLAIAFSCAVLVAYAYALRPYGFVIPTFVAAGLISFQISPRPVAAALTGLCLAVGLFVLFRYVLGLGLVALPGFLNG